MDLFSFLSFHFICVTVTVVTGHSVALSRCSHLFSTMSSLHDVLVHDKCIDALFGSTDSNFFCSRPQISTKTGSLRFGNK
jgi:hypothetical protein